MKYLVRIFNLFALLGSIISLQAQESAWISGRPDGHAPIGVMGDHTHGKGEFMLSYRYMRMDMEGMRNGTDEVSPQEVISPEGFNYRVSPTSMPMDMHMFGAMYAPSDALTLMLMVPVLDNSMDHLTRMGANFSTESSGLGDIKISGLYKFFDKNRQRIHANLGVSLPTGDIDVKGVTPASAPNETQLPYPMQIGTGTPNVFPGITYLGQSDQGSWGVQVLGTLRIGENDREYRFGNQLDATSWIAYKPQDWVSTSIRLRALFIGEIEGNDPTYEGPVNMRMVPTVFPENFGGTQVFGGGGINFFIPTGPLKNIRVATEVEIPLIRELNGVQLETDFVFTLGIQYAL